MREQKNVSKIGFFCRLDIFKVFDGETRVDGLAKMENGPTAESVRNR